MPGYSAALRPSGPQVLQPTQCCQILDEQTRGLWKKKPAKISPSAEKYRKLGYFGLFAVLFACILPINKIAQLAVYSPIWQHCSRVTCVPAKGRCRSVLLCVASRAALSELFFRRCPKDVPLCSERDSSSSRCVWLPPAFADGAANAT